MQNVQKGFLKSTVLIVKVIEALNNARENGQEMNLPDLIGTFSDAVAFIGAANIKMVKTMKEIIKEAISPKLKAICSSETPFLARHYLEIILSSNCKKLLRPTRFQKI